MQVMLYQLRQNGGRVKERARDGKRLGPGTLCSCYVGMPGTDRQTRQLSFVVRDPFGGVARDIVNPLYDFELVGIGDGCMRLSGVQVTPDGRAVVQEWLCELVDATGPSAIQGEQ